MPPSMTDEERSEREIADAILEGIEREYGFVPLVNQVLSERPDLFIPSAGLGRAVMEGGRLELERKERYLCAVAAASAAGGEHCIGVQMKHAVDAGASRGEVLEAMVIGSYMAMTRSQSYAFRKFREQFGDRRGRRKAIKYRTHVPGSDCEW